MGKDLAASRAVLNSTALPPLPDCALPSATLPGKCRQRGAVPALSLLVSPPAGAAASPFLAVRRLLAADSTTGSTQRSSMAC